MKELLKKLNIAPTYDDYRLCRYELIEVAEAIAELKIGIASKKEEYKQQEADLTKELKSNDVKMTIKDIESEIKTRLRPLKLEILELESEFEKRIANYEAVNNFLKSVDWSLYYINNNKNDLIN